MSCEQSTVQLSTCVLQEDNQDSLIQTPAVSNDHDAEATASTEEENATNQASLYAAGIH